MRLKTLLAIVIAVVALAALVVGTAYCTSYITDSVGDPWRFSFVGITANGVKLGENASEIDSGGTEYTADTFEGEIVSYSVDASNGLDLWVEGINHERELSAEGLRTIEELRTFLIGPGKKSWYDKERGLRSEVYRDVLNKIAVEIIYNNADGSLVRFAAEQET
jgi:uncharacterized protein YxeA